MHTGSSIESAAVRRAVAVAGARRGSGLCGWTLTTQTATARQALLGGVASLAPAVHQVRAVDEARAVLRVYTRHGRPVRQGVAAVTLDPAADLVRQVADACAASRAVGNPPWELAAPPAGAYPAVAGADAAIAASPDDELARLLAVLSGEAGRARGMHVNSAEAYVTLRRMRFETASGIDVAREASEVYVEFAAEREPGPNRQEVHPFVEATSVDGLDLAACVARAAEEVAALGDTERPATTEVGIVVLGPEAISALLHDLCGLLAADAEYERGPHVKPGEPVADGPLAAGGEALALSLDPLRPAMAESTSFTPEGLPAEGACVIAQGLVRRQLVSHRMGQYLGRPANGLCGNMIVPLGRRPKEAWFAELPDCLEIRSFSSLLIDPRTLTWSSEIKLARRHGAGRAPRPVKGGVVSGSFRENLRDCAFSAARRVRNDLADGWKPARGYDGPDALLIRRGVRIAGGSGA